jgi:hypothetical protein
VDVIADKFFEFKGRAKTKSFSSKKAAELYLCISHEKYDDILTHLVDLDFNEGQQVRLRSLNIRANFTRSIGSTC